MVTGGYNKSAHVIDINATSNTSIQCNYNEKHGSKAGKLKVYSQQKETTLKSSLKISIKWSIHTASHNKMNPCLS